MVGQEEEVVQAASKCADLTLEESIYGSAHECRPQSLQDSGRLSNKKAASGDSPDGETSSPSVATLKLPSRNPAQSKDFPCRTVGSEDFSATLDPVNELTDPSFPQTQSVSGTSAVLRTSGSRDKETQQLLDFLRSCKPAKVKKIKPSAPEADMLVSH